jgi:Reverse transcriptase (RNA-dependent DNA polymerase).
LYDLENRPQVIAIEAEDELDEDDNGPTILKSEVVKAIKDMRRKKATGDNNIPIDLLEELGDSGLKIMTALVNKIYISGDWPKDFLDFTMITLSKKNQAKKCSDHRTISLISHTEKIVARILSKRLESKIEEVIEEDQFGFRKGKGTRDAIGLMRIMSERALDVKEEMCLCFIDWQKTFAQKYWRERRLITYTWDKE